MGNMFNQSKIVDENNVEHFIFTEYFYQGKKYYITRDNKIFIKLGDSYKEIPAELSKAIFDKINSLNKKDVVEFDDYGEK